MKEVILLLIAVIFFTLYLSFVPPKCWLAKDAFTCKAIVESSND